MWSDHHWIYTYSVCPFNFMIYLPKIADYESNVSNINHILFVRYIGSPVMWDWFDLHKYQPRYESSGSKWEHYNQLNTFIWVRSFHWFWRVKTRCFGHQDNESDNKEEERNNYCAEKDGFKLPPHDVNEDSYRFLDQHLWIGTIWK